jgi:hypothetical protein
MAISELLRQLASLYLSLDVGPGSLTGVIESI